MNSIGARLTYIRAPLSQRVFTDQIGVPLRTYQTFEQDKREPDLRTLTALHDLGWNINWVLTGEGTERLEALQDKGSQPARPDLAILKSAVEVLERALDEAGATTTDAAGRAELLVAVYELLEEGAALDAAERIVASMLRAVSKTGGASTQSA